MNKSTDYSDMQGPCSEGFHIPTNDERTALYNAGLDLGAWASSGGANNYSTYLKIPKAGRRLYTNATIADQNTIGYYWSSIWVNTGNARYNSFGGNNQGIRPNGGYSTPSGFSIRPFKDVAVTPDSSWTELYTNGIYWSSTLGLISIKNGTSWITIADKNLGATQVYNYGDTLSETNAGKYYQRGNNYGFAWTGSVTTSSTQVDASSYGPGNYYSSSTFITSSADNGWDSSHNQNIRGGVSGIGGEKEPKKIYIRVDLPIIMGDFLLVGGGGGGGGSCTCNYPGGGGGAGTFIECSNYELLGGEYCVVVGTPGIEGHQKAAGCNGGDSCFNGFVAYGGGGGGGSAYVDGCAGGNGGGGRSTTSGYCAGGAGCTGWYNGGCGCSYAGGGGGGGCGVGGNGGYDGRYGGGNGGAGIQSDISGTCVWYSTGGGGGALGRCVHGVSGSGSGIGQATACGGGGGGGQYCCRTDEYGYRGGCGVFIFRYPTACGYDVSGGTCYTCGDYTIHCFTSDGTLTIN